jgi:hypothetical protein
LFVVLASAFGAGLLAAGASIPQMFLAAALLNAAVALYIYLLVPEFLMRFLAWILIHSIYRLRKTGLENIPETGPAVLACNHVSFVDAVVILAACPRPVRFLMDHQIFRIPILSLVFRTGKAIPIAPQGRARVLQASAPILPGGAGGGSSDPAVGADARGTAAGGAATSREPTLATHLPLLLVVVFFIFVLVFVLFLVAVVIFLVVVAVAVDRRHRNP